MKVVRLFEHGDTSVLKYDDYPMPEAGPSDLLMRVLATLVSRWDAIYRQGIRRKGAFDHKLNRAAHLRRVAACGNRAGACDAGARRDYWPHRPRPVARGVMHDE